MKAIWIILIGFLCWNCKSNPQTKGETPPAQSIAPDSNFAWVFTPWDGTWKGVFTVFEDTRGQQASGAKPAIRSLTDLDSLPLEKPLR